MMINRYPKNPILTPDKNQSWQEAAVFNGCPVEKNGKIFLLYRAMSYPHYHAFAQKVLPISDIGIAESDDGVNFKNQKKFITPELEWEKYGCEDPRVTKLDNEFFIFYTAISQYPFSPDGIKVAVAITDNLEKIKEKHLVTPFNAKAMALFPKKINGKIWGILTVHTDKPPAKICLVSFDKKEDIWSPEFWFLWYQDFEKYSLPLKRHPADHLELGSPPLETPYGWLVFYSYIRNYFSQNRLFGVEALLLDKSDPKKILARTDYPLLTPEEYYEKEGQVKEVVFPSGALLKDETVFLYYGAADTVCCLATINLSSLLDFMFKKNLVSFSRYQKNPILTADKHHPWEEKAVFNPAAIYLEGNVHLLYRAMSADNTSVFGYARSHDGKNIDFRAQEPVYFPRQSFEQKTIPGSNSGCEDPRLTKIGDKIYMCYTAFDGKNHPRVAFTSIKVTDFLSINWRWEKPVLLSPPDFSDKDALLFPEKVGDNYMFIHRVGNNVNYAFVSSLDFEKETFLEEYHWIKPRPGFWDSKKIGAAAPPIKTEKGWLLLYHGLSDDEVYRVGALLLDKDDPTKVLGRTDHFIFEPEKDYEKYGQVKNVVFPCGVVLIEDEVYIYYGGADSVCALATVKLNDLLSLFS